MPRRPSVTIVLLAVVVLSGCTVGYQPAADASGSEPAAESNPLGYHDGYWHDDTLDVDPADGLTAAETEAVVSRAMARVQLLRGLRFEHDVEVEVITREMFREEFSDVWSEPSEGRRSLDNAQHEALFLVGSDEDVVDVRRANRGGTVLGFYQSSEERLVVVSGTEPATLEDEITLAHELVHALQDQRFGLEHPEEATLDASNARLGLIEGEATVVERAYERNCETGEWQCVDLGTDSSSAISPEFHWGVYFIDFVPYAEGPTFVEYHRDRGGWEAVNRMHDAPPTTSAELIRPGSYRTDAHGEAIVRDRNTDRWERVTVPNGSDFATVGRAGLASMFAYTAYAGDGAGVINRSEFRNTDPDASDAPRPFRYDVPRTEGWYADRLHAYERGGQLAHVWNVTFNDAENATAFREGYEHVAAYWGGTRRSDTVWTFGDGSRFDGAVRIERDGNVVTIVKAPSRSELRSVHAPSRQAVTTSVSAAAD